MTKAKDEATDSVDRLWIDHSEDPDHDQCANCGSKVSKDFRRVFGDNRDIAFACLECRTEREVMDGAAAGQEVTML